MLDRSPALMVMLIAGAVAGCGAASNSAGRFQGVKAKVAAAVDALSSAASSHDTTKICTKILDPALSAKLKTVGGSCTSVVGKQLDTVDTFNVPVQSVTVSADGGTAQATVKSTSNGKDRTDTFNLVLLPKDGTWRIASLR